MMLTELADVLRSAGLKVMEEQGWKSRTRPGGMLGVRTITCHHTANGGAPGNAPSLRVVREGRGGSNPLPGPLSQLFLAVDGTWHVVAAGKANHAGASRETRFSNDWALGIEAEARGTGHRDDWPEQQMTSYARGCAALVKHYRLSVADVRGHKETCSPVGRKIDPSFPMPEFRHRVGAVDLTRKEVSGMELSDDIVLTETAARVMSVPGYTPRKAGDELSVSYIMQWGGAGISRLLGLLKQSEARELAMAARMDAMTQAVNALAAGSPDGIRAAFADGEHRIRAALADFEVRVTLVEPDDEQ